MRVCRLLVLATLGLSSPMNVLAQEPPPRIGPLVIDVRGTVPRFDQSDLLAQSRGLVRGELPRTGLGVDAGAHFYVFKWKAVTFGLGGEVTLARAHASPAESTGLRSVTERFTSITPQLSLNFGSGNGWSYLSAGIGAAKWKIVPDGAEEMPADRERLRTVNYGGGARWFIKRHVAFNVDVRFHQVDPGTPTLILSADPETPSLALPGSPRTTFMIFGGGISVK
jgi:hypothetical protein